MEEDLIAAEDLCNHYHIEKSFISSLQESGLIEVTSVEQRMFLRSSQLVELEKFCRLHYDLNINIEGIEAITHLLQQVQELQDELTALRNRLRQYENYSQE